MMLRSMLIAGLLAIPVSEASAGEIELDSREYKLMLKPAMFDGREPADVVRSFASNQLRPVVAKQVGGNAAMELVGKPFKLDEQRLVRFFDTPTCLLDQQRLVLRARSDIDNPGSAELTLKYRSPDLFVTAGAPLRAVGGEVETKLEEDIGPLAAVFSPKTRGKSGSMRSQFSLSSSRSLAAGSLPLTLGGLLDLYPDLDRPLHAAPGSSNRDEPLVASPDYREIVYDSAKIDLTEGHKTKFSITVWYQGADNREQPALAEISFKYDVEDGSVPRDLALVGMNLFLAMQDLDGVDSRPITKSRLVATSCATS